MADLVEWFVEFVVWRPDRRDIALSNAEAILDAITSWAEEYEYGIGGGFEPVAEPIPHIRFNLGLCATRDGQLIPSVDAEALMRFIRRHLQPSLLVAGGYRPFSDGEVELQLFEDLVARILPDRDT